MTAKYCFSRESRLLTPSAFSNVFQQAIPAVSPHFTILARHNQLDTPRLGVTVAKKKAKRAVDRNKIKRIVRESFRLKRHQLPNVDIIVIAKNGIADISKSSLHSQLEKLWPKMTKRCTQNQKT